MQGLCTDFYCTLYMSECETDDIKLTAKSKILLIMLYWHHDLQGVKNVCYKI